MPTSIAERLIVSGFFAEVLEQLPMSELAIVVDAAIDERLDRRIGHDAGDPAPSLADGGLTDASGEAG